MTYGRAAGIVVFYVAWAGVAFGGAEPSRDDVVRALMQRSRLLDDVQFQLPVEIYRLYLTERAAEPEKAPTAFIIEQGRYGVTLDKKNQPSLRVELSVDVLDPAGGREVPVLSAALAWDEVTVNGQASRLAEKDGWLQLMPDKAGVYSIAAAAKLGRAWADKARIVLAAAPSVRTVAKFDAPGKWRITAGGAMRVLQGAAEGGTHVELPLVPSRRISIAWARPVTLPPRPPRYELTGAIAWNIDAGRQQVAARMNVRILGSATDRLTLSVPPGALKCKITGPDVREMRLSPGSAAVFLRGPVTGQTRLDVSYELPIGAAAVKPLAAPGVADGHWSSGTLVVTETAGASELLAGDIRGLREIHAGDIPAEARAILIGKPVLAYEITSRDLSASVEVLNLGEFALRESIADMAHYQVLFRPDGSVMCKIDYEIRNRTRQFLRVHLPAGSRVLSARVNDVPKTLTPVAGESDVSLLPLVRSKASVKGLVSFPVQIVVLYRGSALGRRGLAELALPTIDLPIAYGWCDLYAPAGMEVRRWGGPMRSVERFSSETAVASLSYGSAELAEGYRPEDRLKTTKAPKPAQAEREMGAPVLSRIPIIKRLFDNRASSRDGSPTVTQQILTGGVTRPATQPARPQATTTTESQSLPIEQLTTTVKVPDGGTLLIGGGLVMGGQSLHIGFDPNNPTKVGQSLPMELPAPRIKTGVSIRDGGTVLLGGQVSGGQSLLAQNYFRAGKDYYAKGDYANAARSLGNVRRMAPGSVEATNAGRLLANIDVVHGRAKASSREEKALGKKVKAEIAGQNVALEQRQTKLLELAREMNKNMDLVQARISYKAAEGLGRKLIAQGASKSEQDVRLRKARSQIEQIDEQQKGQVEKVRQQYKQLKAHGKVEQAFQVGNVLQRLSKEKDEKTALRGELEKLAVSSVQQSAITDRADKLYGSDMRWRDDAGMSKVPSAGLSRVRNSFTRWGGESDKDAPAPLAVTGESWGAMRVIDQSAKVRVGVLTEQAKALRGQQKYDQAREVVEEVLRIDPSDKWAANEKQLLTEFSILQNDVRTFHDERREEAKSLTDARAPGEAWYRHLRYPRNWKQLTEDRKEFQASAAGETPEDAALREKLMRQIERLSFADIDFQDVITFLREYSDANIHVNWRALTNAGIKQTTKVSVDVRKITVKRALDLVLRDVSGAAAGADTQLRYVIDGGILTISTKSDLAREPIRRVYDIRDLLVPVPGFEGPRIELQRAAQPAQPRSGVVTRTYDVRDLVIASDGEQTVDDIGRRGRDLERNVRGSLGRGNANAPDVDTDGDALGDLRIADGKLTVTADIGGQKRAGELLKKLREIRGPQVELGGNIAGQRAYGLLNADSLTVTKGLLTRVQDRSGSKSSPGGTFLDDIQVDFANGRGAGEATEASKARFEDYIRRNYGWEFSNGSLGEQGRPGGVGGGGSGAWGRDSGDEFNGPLIGAGIAKGGRVQDREKVVRGLATKLSSNLWQDVAVNSRNISLSAKEASGLGITFQQGVNSVNFATVDEAQLRTLRQLEARRGGKGRKVAANPRLQETIVGTEALLAGGQRAYVARAGERSNTIDLAGNPIVLSHEKYVLIDAGGYITAVKAGEMQHWTQTVKDEDVGFADVPQELDLPRVGNHVKFEKTLIRPADRLTIRAEYTWKGAAR